MTKRILRSFFYLDEQTVDDFLSQLEGGVLDGTYTEKTSTTGGREGGLQAGFHGLSASGKAGKSTTSEVEQTIKETVTARFSRLYDYLQQDDLIQPLSGFDQGTYDQLNAGEIVEFQGKARLTQWEKILMEWDSFVRMQELMKSMGQEPTQNPQFEQMSEVMSQLKVTAGREDTPIIVTPVNAPAFQFVVVMSPHKMRRKKEEFEAEITVLGKIQRKLERGDKIDVFRLVSRFATIQNMNRAARLQGRKSSKGLATDSPIDEIVEYPALEITPVAIYS